MRFCENIFLVLSYSSKCLLAMLELSNITYQELSGVVSGHFNPSKACISRDRSHPTRFFIITKEAYWAAVVKDPARYCREHHLEEKRFDLHSYKNNPDCQPAKPPSHWIRTLEKLFNYGIFDEAHECLRNQSSTWRAAK